MTEAADMGLHPTSELVWVRLQIAMLLSAHDGSPLSLAELARYDDLCRFEAALVDGSDLPDGGGPQGIGTH
jgi:hypothetical protein